MERRIVRNINYFLEWVLRQIGRKAWVSARRSWHGNLTLTEICELKFSVIQAWCRKVGRITPWISYCISGKNALLISNVMVYTVRKSNCVSSRRMCHIIEDTQMPLVSYS